MVVRITKIIAIHDSHRSIGHFGKAWTYADASKNCHNVTHALFKMCIASCYHCHHPQIERDGNQFSIKKGG